MQRKYGIEEKASECSIWAIDADAVMP